MIDTIARVGGNRLTVSVSRSVQDALNLYGRYSGTMLLASFLVYLLSVCTFLIALPPLYGGFLVFCLHAMRNPGGAKIENLFAEFRRFFGWWGLTLVFLLVYLPAMLLLVVPGLLLWSMWFFASPIYADTRLGPIQSLGGSWRLIRRMEFGPIFLLVLFSFAVELVGIALSAIPFVGILFQSCWAILTTPFTTGIVCSAYIQAVDEGLAGESAIG